MSEDWPVFVAGLWSDAPDPSPGEIADNYTMVIGDANAAMRVHVRMPAELVPLGKRVETDLAGPLLLDDLPLEGHRVGAMPCHGSSSGPASMSIQIDRPVR